VTTIPDEYTVTTAPQEDPRPPRLMPYAGPLSTRIGKEWAVRRRIAETYYERNCWDFDELLNLYVAAEQKRAEWNANVAMGWSVLQALVADTFFKNPEPVILPLTPGREEQARMLTDIGRTWHETAGTEDNVMRARIIAGLQGGAIIWIDEDADYQDALALDDDNNPRYEEAVGDDGGPIPDEYGQPMRALDENGEPIPLYEIDPETGEVLKEAVRQEFRQTLIDLHSWRVDPDCRRWDHKDAKWVERRYQRSLKDFLDDDAFSEKAKSMLLAWSKSRRRQRAEWDRGANGLETDPALIMIDCGEIWSMAHGRIFHIPVDAEFHLEGATAETAEGFPMPEFWRANKMYPCVMFAYNWHPPDRAGIKGYYPIPDLRLVKSHLKNLIRLEGLILNLCTQQTTKYLAMQGLLDNTAQRRIASDVPREVIEVDLIGPIKRLTAQGVAVPNLNLDNLITNLRTEQREQLVKHFEAFSHEVDLIREALSQGPAARAGVPDARTATGQLQVGESRSRRLDVDAERTSAYIDGLTERYFILLQARGSLPVYYRDSSDSTGAFRPFVIEQGFRDLKLSFSHRTGTARGVDREVLRAQVREAIGNALPVVQDPVQIQALLKKLFETFDDPTLSKVFENDLSGIAEQGAMLMQALEMGQIGLDEFGPQALELLSAFVNAHMTQSQVDRVAMQASGAPPPPMASGEKQASMKKPRSAGKQAFDTAAGLAAAGRVGGMGAS
jgi:hypothetical protein